MALLSHCCCCNVCFQYFLLQVPIQMIISGGRDYSFTTQSFLLHSGERRCTSIQILDDTIVEQSTESVTVWLRTRPSYGNAATTIYIQDNDGE